LTASAALAASPAVAYGGPDLECVARTAAELRAAGLFTTHLMTVGGWNAPHPNTSVSADDAYAAWRAWNEVVVARPGLPSGFDGIDWDLEGNDDVSSPFNELRVEVLDFVGRFSVLAKRDGYLVSLVPAESYLDPMTEPSFSRSLLLNYPGDVGWAKNFSYHGRNGYAYLLSRYGGGGGGGEPETFDLVLIQLYESFSHLTYNVTLRGQSAASYIAAWARRVVAGW
jgi:hypothetical protein